MGFWSNVWSATKAIATGVAEGIAETVRFVGGAIEAAGSFIEDSIKSLGKKDENIIIDSRGVYNPPRTDGGSINEKEEKRRLEEENEVIRKFQEKVAKNAEWRENSVHDAYLNIYETYLRAFEKVFDAELMQKIESFIKKTSTSFTNIIRDDVNEKVNSSNYSWKALTSSHPSEKQLQAYCDKVRSDAYRNLLDFFKFAINDTNEYISQRIIEYNENKAKALAEMKESLVKLTSDEETKAQELKKIAEELAVAQFIANETSKEI